MPGKLKYWIVTIYAGNRGGKYLVELEDNVVIDAPKGVMSLKGKTEKEMLEWVSLNRGKAARF